VIQPRPTASEAVAPRLVTPLEAQACIGQEVGVSPWLLITQERVNQFAEATGDFQYLHVDAERARTQGPFGGTVAHGFLTLALLTQLGSQGGMLRIRDAHAVINYGLDTVRFVQPVPVGARIRARFVLESVADKGPDRVLLTHRCTVEIEGSERPAMVAQWLSMSMI
jgi:acyl dehydratase